MHRELEAIPQCALEQEQQFGAIGRFRRSSHDIETVGLNPLRTAENPIGSYAVSDADQLSPGFSQPASPAFEAASIKPSKGNEGHSRAGCANSNGGHEQSDAQSLACQKQKGGYCLGHEDVLVGRRYERRDRRIYAPRSQTFRLSPV